jgi:RimJ/RimL family protein N-acetyltransferase
MVPDYGDAPVVIIERNLNDVVESVYDAFDKPEGVACWHHAIENYLNVYKKALDEINTINCLRVHFNDINDRLEEIWAFLVPDIKPDIEHLLTFSDAVIKTDNRDIEGSLINTFDSMENFARQYDVTLLDPYRITDYAVAQYIINECWYEISEDNAPHYVPDIIKEYWIGIYNDDEMLVGCCRFHQLTSITWEAHAFVLSEFRKEYGVVACFTSFRWLLDNTDCQKLVANVPERFPNVMGYLEKIGFKKEGVNRQSYTKDNKIWDVINYGLTRPEIERVL